MTKEIEKLNKEVQRLNKKGEMLKQAVLINSINEAVDLIRRYEAYLEQFNRLGNKFGKILLKENYRYLKLDEMKIKLYLDNSTCRVLFENHTNLLDYYKSNIDLSIYELIDLYCNQHYESLKVDFGTPVEIADNILHQLPNSLYCPNSNCTIDGVIKKLMSIRAGKIDRLIAEFF